MQNYINLNLENYRTFIKILDVKYFNVLSNINIKKFKISQKVQNLLLLK